MITHKPRPAFRRACGNTRFAHVDGHVAPKPRRADAAFSLLEISIVVTIIALVTAVSVNMGQSMIQSADIVATNHKLNVIEQALMSYRLTNERLPCPADASLPATSAYYGFEAGTMSGSQWVPDAGSCMTSGTYSGGTNGGTLTGTAANSVAANDTYLVPKGANATNIAFNTYVAEGAVPFKALNLPESFMYDSWGRKIAYAVWAPDTAESAFITYGITPSCGAIRVNDASGNPRSQSSVYALVSFGPDGHGGYLKDGTRYFSGSDNGDGGASPQPPAGAGEWTDCHCNANADAGNYTATYVQKEWSEDPNDSKDTFDDLVRFKERWQMVDQHDYFSAAGMSCIPGFRIDSVTSSELLGWNNSSNINLAVGDVNGDGIPDLIIGSPYTNNPGGAGFGGTVYVIFGTKQGFPDPLPLNTLNGSNGFALVGAYDAQEFGQSVAVADMNGDGIGDIVIGGKLYNSNGAGYVVFGHSGNWSASYTVNHAFFNGVNGAEFDGPANSEVYNGSPVAVGDFNGDGIADMVIGMPLSSTNGSVFIVFGKKGGWPTQPITLSTAVTGAANNGSGLIRLTLSTTAPYAGTQGMATGNTVLVSGIIGTTEANGRWTVTVVDASHIDLQGSTFTNAYVSGGTASSVINGVAGVEYDGPASASYAYGSMVLAVGDVNGDGNADLLIGAPYTNSGVGALYAMFGRKCGGSGTACTTPVTINASLLNGTTGTEFDGVGAGTLTYFPSAVTVADANGDGIGDIITNTAGEGGGAGVVIVIYGRSSGWPTAGQQLTVGSSSYINGTNGFELHAGGSPFWAGDTLAVGDVNGDGKLDFFTGGIEGSNGGSPNWTGTGLLVFGQASWPYKTNVNSGSYYNGTNGVEFDGTGPGMYTGSRVAIADLNGDGIPDLIISAPYNSPNGVTNAGSIYVYFGKKGGWPATPYNLGNL